MLQQTPRKSILAKRINWDPEQLLTDGEDKEKGPSTPYKQRKKGSEPEIVQPKLME